MRIPDITKDFISKSDQVSDMPEEFIQFMILWLSFNALCSENYTGGDRKKVIAFATEHKELYKRLKTEAFSDVVNDFIRTIPGGERRVDVRDMSDYSNKKKAAKFGDENNTVEDFFAVVYKIRCNLFHRDKPDTEGDKAIVGWGYKYLKVFLDEVIKLGENSTEH